MFLVARSAPGEPPQKITAALENAIHELGPDVDRALTYADGLPHSRIVTGVWLRQNSMRDFLVGSAVAGGAGGVILMLAALGIYGVVGLMVATRTGRLVRLNGENMGIPLSNMEPLAYVAGAAVAVLVAVLASLAPARRAASVQPMVAMRSV